MFSIYINDVSDVLCDSDVVLIEDDIVIHQHNASLDQLALNMNKSMGTFNDYCLFNYLTVNNIKTKFMVYSREKISNPPVILSNNEEIEYVLKFKYLGIIIDYDLKHFSHLRSLIVFMKQQIGIINCISKYFNLNAAYTYYYAYIYSKLNYGINAWGGVLLSHSESNTLKKLQSRVIKSLFGQFYVFQRREQLYGLLNILKLDDMYRYNLMVIMFKITNTNEIPFLYENVSNFAFKHAYNTRSNILKVPIRNNKYMSYNFIYRAILTYNELPNAVKEIKKFSTFKNDLKTHYLRLY